ncbi:ATP-binding protein [Ruminococcus sp. Marseille-P6503]|uniref:ATP-binding protein n=1 Tax=Ruminococcus sp. Marseille-P6503 TaxID=2364796 RepID=UPI000F52E538|nr:ATP-binding protein [Ruminococcus sp. Marseille-P6503]
MFEISKGIINSAQKVVVYGPEGIGKSTFAAQFPDPLFIDTEGSTKRMDVRRFPKPTSWEMLNGMIKEAVEKKLCKTLVIDTIDWAEQLCIRSICGRYQKTGIEDFGYGKGYVYEREEFGAFLNLLTEAVESGINVVLTAHAQLKKFEQPDDFGSYDRYELKLGQKTGSQISPLVKEWADMLLFANYKVFSVAVDKDGKKYRPQGGERIMYTSHHPCWDAKNRDGLPEEMPFRYESVAHLFAQYNDILSSRQAAEQRANDAPPETEREQEEIQKTLVIPDNIPPALRDLMRADNVSEEEIREVVAQQGYCPVDMPIANYPPDFISGCLIADWQTVLKMINELDINGVPF